MSALCSLCAHGRQVLEFAKEVVGDKVFIVCNSVGGVAGLQAGIDNPDQVDSCSLALFAPYSTAHDPVSLPVKYKSENTV